MKFLRFVINDDLWNFYIIPEDDHDTLDSLDSEAEVDFTTKEVHIKEANIDLVTLLHELWHIHHWYCFLFSANMSKDDMEEVGAELFSRRGEHIIKQGKELLELLENLKKNDEDF